MQASVLSPEIDELDALKTIYPASSAWLIKTAYSYSEALIDFCHSILPSAFNLTIQMSLYPKFSSDLYPDTPD